MTEIKITQKWKNRIMRWMRYLLIVFAMWTIHLSNNYVSIPFYQWVINAFQIIIIAFTILYEEYTDAIITALDLELERIKHH
jgi:hypothetical protein